MNVRVDENRFLSVACEPQERVVFDRQETKYHLLRDEAARLWDEIGDGGSFELASVLSEAEDPIAQLVDAGLISIEADHDVPQGISRRVWLTRTGKASAAAIVLPLVATIATPRFALGQVNASLEERVTDEPLDELESQMSSFEERQTRREERRTRRRSNTDDSTTTSGPTTETPTTSPATTETTLSDQKAERRAERKLRRQENQD